MLSTYKFQVASVFIAGVLAACAPRTAPEPIRAEPVFDKFGAPMCRPEDQPISTAYPARLPICEEICREGQQIPGAAPQVICPPDPRRPDRTPNDGGDDDTPRIPGTTSVPPASVPPATAAPPGTMTAGTAPRP